MTLTRYVAPNGSPINQGPNKGGNGSSGGSVQTPHYQSPEYPYAPPAPGKKAIPISGGVPAPGYTWNGPAPNPNGTVVAPVKNAPGGDVSGQQAQANDRQASVAQSVIASLNASAEKVGSQNRYLLQGRPGSLAVFEYNASAPYSAAPPIESFAPKAPGDVYPGLTPVASGPGNSVYYSDKQGNVINPVASLGLGEVGFSKVVSTPDQSVLQLPDIGVNQNTFYLNEQQRRDIMSFGNNLVATADSPGLFGVPRDALGSSLRKTIGGNIASFGYDPESYFRNNIALPLVGGLVTGGAFAAAEPFIPVLGEAAGLSEVAASRLGSFLGLSAGVIGTGSVIVDVGLTPASERTPAPVLGALGAVAGYGAVADSEFFSKLAFTSKDTVLSEFKDVRSKNAQTIAALRFSVEPGTALRPSDISVPVAERLFPGPEYDSSGNLIVGARLVQEPIQPFFENKEGAAFKGGRRVSPQSKAEIRKQSYNQAYNPNVYSFGNGGIAERTPSSFRSAEYLGVDSMRSTELRLKKTGAGTNVVGKQIDVSLQPPRQVTDARFFIGTIPKGDAYELGGKGYSRPPSQVSPGGSYDVSQGPVGELSLKQKQINKLLERNGNAVGQNRNPSYPSLPSKNNPSIVIENKPLSDVPQYTLENGKFVKVDRNARVNNNPSGRGRVLEELKSRVRSQQEALRAGRQLVPSSPYAGQIVLPKGEYFVEESPGVGYVASIGGSGGGDVIGSNGKAASRSGSSNPFSSMGFEKLGGASTSKLGGNKFGSLGAVAVGVSQRQNNGQGSRVDSALAIGSKSGLISSPQSRTISVQDTSQVQSQDVSQVQVQDTALVQEVVSDVLPKDVFFGGGGVTPPPRPPPPSFKYDNPRPPPPGYDGGYSYGDYGFGRGGAVLPRIKSVSPKTALFKIVVGRPGEKTYYVKVGTLKDVVSAKDYVLNGAAASVKVTPLTPGSGNVGSVFADAGFYENKKGAYVQPNRTRISSAGEKREIPGVARVKNSRPHLTEGKAFKIALSLNQKGVPLRDIRKSKVRRFF